MTTLTTFFSQDGQREAHVVRAESGLHVEAYEFTSHEMALVRIIDVSTHSEYYAEDTAENWVTYVIRN